MTGIMAPPPPGKDGGLTDGTPAAGMLVFAQAGRVVVKAATASGRVFAFALTDDEADQFADALKAKAAEARTLPPGGGR